MRYAILITGLAATLSWNLAAEAQTSKDEAITTTTPQTPTAPANTAQALAITDRYMIPVQAEIVSRIDTRDAKVGQQVTARTRADARLADNTELPKGTTLIGHVVQVQSHATNDGNSLLAVTFDHAQLKGQSVPLRTVIRTIGTTPSGTTGMMPRPDTAMGAGVNPMTTGNLGVNGGLGAGGGLGNGGGLGTSASGGIDASTGGDMGGGNIGTIPNTTNTTPIIRNGTGLGGVVRGPVNGRGQVPDPAGTTQAAMASVSSAGGVVRKGDLTTATPHPTGLPGVMLSNSTAAGVSGTLLAPGQEITLMTGTHLTLGVIAAR